MIDILKTILKLNIAFAIGYLATTYVFNKLPHNINYKFSGAARLTVYEDEVEAGGCSAVVISDTLALTAAHCVLAPKPPVNIFDVLSNKQFKYPELTFELQQNGIVLPVIAKAGNGVDFAILKGDFKGFKKAVITKEAMFDMETEYVSCGYPRLRKHPLCIKLGKPVINHFDLMGFKAGIVPGMSGGPVYNDSGELVGLNITILSVQYGGGSFMLPLAGLIGD